MKHYRNNTDYHVHINHFLLSSSNYCPGKVEIQQLSFLFKETSAMIFCHMLTREKVLSLHHVTIEYFETGIIVCNMHARKLCFMQTFIVCTTWAVPVYLCERGFLPGSVGGLQAPTNWILSSVIQVWSKGQYNPCSTICCRKEITRWVPDGCRGEDGKPHNYTTYNYVQL